MIVELRESSDGVVYSAVFIMGHSRPTFVRPLRRSCFLEGHKQGLSDLEILEQGGAEKDVEPDVHDRAAVEAACLAPTELTSTLQPMAPVRLSLMFLTVRWQVGLSPT